MPDRPPGRLGSTRRLLLVTFVFLGAIALSPSGVGATVNTQPDDATGVETSEPGATEVETTQVDTTDVDTTDVVDTTPEETAPADTTTGPSDGLVGANPDPDTGDVALIAIVGLVVVLSLAAWWMVRRDEERPVSGPPPPSGDLI